MRSAEGAGKVRRRRRSRKGRMRRGGSRREDMVVREGAGGRESGGVGVRVSAYNPLPGQSEPHRSSNVAKKKQRNNRLPPSAGFSSPFFGRCFIISSSDPRPAAALRHKHRQSKVLTRVSIYSCAVDVMSFFYSVFVLLPLPKRSDRKQLFVRVRMTLLAHGCCEDDKTEGKKDHNNKKKKLAGRKKNNSK